MMYSKCKILLLLFLINWSCNSNRQVPEQKEQESAAEQEPKESSIRTGAAQTNLYVPDLKGKNIALVLNQTSRIGAVHLADSLVSLGISIRKIFAPEHGFRGEADAGEQVKDGKDSKTGIPIVSLYGNKKKPGSEDLEGIDMVVFDIQDVGARFYTYIYTMTYVMEACAENQVALMVLDRPNPNGHFVDGPVLQKGFESFVGMHPIPIVHGMTVGEYAQMLNGEQWLTDGVQCELKVIPCMNYDHQKAYDLPVKPSPNLPNMRSIYLYPSLCLFEGTTVNVGRGTQKQFQVYGHPAYQGGDYRYTPQSMAGAKNPKFKGLNCKGYDLSGLDPEDIRSDAKLNLAYLINYYKTFPKGETFFLKNKFFDKLAGGDKLRNQILNGMDEVDIRRSWKKDLEDFKNVREKYLLYP